MSSLSFAHVEQGLGVVTAGRPGRGLAYVARAIIEDTDNASARSLALDAVIHANWVLPEAVVRQPGISLAGFGARDATMLTVSADGAARLWSVAAPQAIRTLRHDAAPITAAAIRRRTTLSRRGRPTGRCAFGATPAR